MVAARLLQLNVRGGSQGPGRWSAAGSRGSGATNADETTMVAAAAAGDGRHGRVELKRGGNTTKYCGCSDVTTPQLSARREAAAAIVADEAANQQKVVAA